MRWLIPNRVMCSCFLVVSLAAGVMSGLASVRPDSVAAAPLQQTNKTWTMTFKTRHVGDDCCTTCAKDKDSGYLNTTGSGSAWQGKRIAFNAWYRNVDWWADTWSDSGLLDKDGSITNGVNLTITDNGAQITLECGEVDKYNNHVVQWTVPTTVVLSGRTYALESGDYLVQTSGTHASMSWWKQPSVVQQCVEVDPCSCVDCYKSFNVSQSGGDAVMILEDIDEP